MVGVYTVIGSVAPTVGHTVADHMLLDAIDCAGYGCTAVDVVAKAVSAAAQYISPA